MATAAASPTATLEDAAHQPGQRAARGNVFTVESTHGNGSVTAHHAAAAARTCSTSRPSPATCRSPPATAATRCGSAARRATSASSPACSTPSTPTSTRSTAGCTVDGGTGSADTLKVYDAGDTDARERPPVRRRDRRHGHDARHRLHRLRRAQGLAERQRQRLLRRLHAHRRDAASTWATSSRSLNGVNDVVNINSISGPTTIDAGQGNDVIRVNFNANRASRPSSSGIDGELDAARPAGQRPLRDRPRGRDLVAHQRVRPVARRPGHQPAAHLRHQPGRLLPAPRQQGHRRRAWSRRSRSTRTACRWRAA